MQEMEKRLGVRVGKGKVDPEVLSMYTDVVAPAVLPKVVRAILEAVFSACFKLLLILKSGIIPRSLNICSTSGSKSVAWPCPLAGLTIIGNLSGIFVMTIQ